MTTCPFCASSLPTAALTCLTCGASLVSLALEIGAVIGGKYRIEQVLGQGGFGITYLALDTTLDHRVAIKELFVEGSTRRDGNVIPPQNIDFALTKEKFLEEAQTVQRFKHDGIVRVYGVFEANQTAYMVMEALSGATLTTDVLENGAFPPKTVLELARQLCASLEIVHEADLLHRDIKPDNVFLSSDGRVVLIDFGSARGFAQGQVKRLTRLITPGYAAPEQYASQAAFGTYTDVYGLAATLYYAVEGQMPPMATDLMLGSRLEFKNAQHLQSGLEAGLKVKVDERPQTVEALLNLLEGEVVNSSAMLFYDQNGISISLNKIVLRGKSLAVLNFKGFSVVLREKRFENLILEKIWYYNAVLCTAAVHTSLFFIVFIFLAFASTIFFIIAVSGFITFIITIFLAFFLELFMIEDFKAKFVLIDKAHQKMELLETGDRQVIAQLEQALLKVIPKIP